MFYSLAGKIIGTILVIAAVVVVSIVTAGIGTAITGALGGGLVASIVGGAVGGAISGAIFGAGMSIVSQGLANGYGSIDWNQVGVDTLVGALSGAVMGAAFAVGGRALGLLGKTKWAQRTVDFSKKKNYFFGSESGNFTFLRIGKKFRIEASIQHGIHMHYKTLNVGFSVARTKLINNIWNSLVGLTTGFVKQFG